MLRFNRIGIGLALLLFWSVAGCGPTDNAETDASTAGPGQSTIPDTNTNMEDNQGSSNIPVADQPEDPDTNP